MEKTKLGFARHQIIKDSQGRSVDFIFLEINPAFEKITGMKKQEILNKRVTEVLPGIINDQIDWIDIFGRVALEGVSDNIEEYSSVFGKWLSVDVFSCEPGYFTTLFRDISEIKERQKESEKLKRRMELALDAGDLGFWDWNLKTGYAYFNPTAHRMMGYETGDIKPEMDAWMNLIHPDDRNGLIKRINNYVENDQPAPEEFRMKCKDGRYKWFSVKGKTYERTKDNQPVRALGVIYDVDKKRREENHRILIENIPTQIWYLKDERTYGAINEAHAGFLGLLKEEIEFKDIKQVFSEQIAEAIIEANKKVFNAGNSVQVDEWLPNSRGEKRLIAITKTPKLDADGNVEYVVCSGQDITEKWLWEKTVLESREKYIVLSHKLERVSVTDELTGLPNRRGFNLAIKREWKRAVRKGYPISLIILDIDYFKYYNDSKGHLEGDQLLKKAAGTLASVFKRPTDLFARYGGDEFVAIIPESQKEGVIQLAEACRKSVEQMAVPNRNSPIADYITISVGIGKTEPGNTDEFEELMRIADKALYRAKERGRNRTEFEVI